MNETINVRELFVLDGLNVIIRGTYHKILDDGSGVASSLLERGRIGVVFLNSLSPTRAANGDSAVYWADSFAKRGYPSFRVDLPGFGDSDGEPPAELVNFINGGGYASIASAKVRELVTRFNLSGVVIMGQCAGSVSALYTAAVSRECRGLILLEPYFNLPQALRPKIREHLSQWALQTRFGSFFSNIYDFLKKATLLLRGNALPENANFPLLRRWKELSSTGLPILILRRPSRKAFGMKPRPGEFDYLDYVLSVASRKSQIMIKVTEGADHSFANSVGRTAVRQHAERWLDAFFAPAKSKDSDVDTLHSRKSECENCEQCLKV